ncbi:MAG: MFS transporter, partial [Gordonia sp. (in: high G+C Gram-positive bacteria)]
MTADTRLPRALRPFALRRYRWLAAGLALALFGDGVWLVAVVWQVIGLGGGPGRVSMVSGIAAVGMVVSTLAGGVLADRVQQRAIMIGLELTKLIAFGSVGIASTAGVLTYWHLAIAALLGGITTGMYYPAYSALLPRVIDAAQLQAANGIEGFLRPVIYQAGGPMLAGLIIGAVSPGAAIVVAAVASAGSGLCYAVMGHVPMDTTPDDGAQHRKATGSILSDLAEGFSYMRRTPWVWATLYFSCLLVLMIMGPIEVLIPFALKDRAGG